MKRILLLLASILNLIISYSQTSLQDTADFYIQIKNLDLITIFAPDSFLIEGPGAERLNVKRAEALGFIDTSYTRFYIHITSARKSIDNPYEYKISGKTRVRTNICSFQGTITFKISKLYLDPEFPKVKVGFAIGEILFYEDSAQTGSGLIKGKLTTHFYLDKTQKPRYNSLMWQADGFCNNQVVGTWTSYKTNKSRKCNWGDYRIPEASDFDMGAGEFSPADKYLKNGWQSYRDSFGKQQKTLDRWWAK